MAVRSSAWSCWRLPRPLPELGTGISAVSIVGEPDLAVGGAFGSNLFNLLIIGLMDIFWWNRYLLNYVGMSSVVVGALGIAVIALGGLAVILHDMTAVFDGLPVSPLSVVLIVGFAVAMYFVYLFEQRQGKDNDEGAAAEPERYASEWLPRHIVIYAVMALVVVGAAVWLSFVADDLAVEMGWEASFMGTQFLAAATSLPELSTSFAALRIAAPELAITNLLGSKPVQHGVHSLPRRRGVHRWADLGLRLADSRPHRLHRHWHDGRRRPRRRHPPEREPARIRDHRGGGADRRVRRREPARVHPRVTCASAGPS